MSRDYIEVEIAVDPVQPGTDYLISELAEFGFESFEETRKGFKAWIPKDDFTETALDVATGMDAALGKASVTWKEIKARNWNEEWESSYQPIRINEKLVIRAPFHAPVADASIELIIQPQQSFGTGHHPTTYLMSEKLLTLPLAGRYVMDMGCGTGILAILAKKLGAAEVEGADIEDWAVDNAKENCRNNDEMDIVIHKGGIECLSGRKFDVILANINKNVLKGAMKDFESSLVSGGDLLLSGFFVTDSEELLKEAGDGWEKQEVRNRDEWCLLHLRKK